MIPSPSVLIISDQRPPRFLEETLAGAGCQVFATDDSREALPLAERLTPAVILMGRQPPGTDALEICRQIQGKLRSGASPIFVVAPADFGASPTDSTGTAAKDAAARRLAQGILSLLGEPSAEPDGQHLLERGGLQIDRRRHHVTLHGRTLPLTLTEFRIIWALALRPGFVVSRRQLTDACRRADSPVQERTIDVHIKSIRRKLKSHAGLIETVRGVGYRLREAEAGEPSVAAPEIVAE